MKIHHIMIIVGLLALFVNFLWVMTNNSNVEPYSSTLGALITLLGLFQTYQNYVKTNSIQIKGNNNVITVDKNSNSEISKINKMDVSGDHNNLNADIENDKN